MLNTMRQLRHKAQIFLKQIQDRVPVLTYKAYIGIEPVEAISAVYIYAFDGDGKLVGGCEVGIVAHAGSVLASEVATSRFFEFCHASVSVVFSSDRVREIWHECVLTRRGVRLLVVVRKKQNLE